jgi:hypothetical protein
MVSHFFRDAVGARVTGGSRMLASEQRNPYISCGEHAISSLRCPCKSKIWMANLKRSDFVLSLSQSLL